MQFNADDITGHNVCHVHGKDIGPLLFKQGSAFPFAFSLLIIMSCFFLFLYFGGDDLIPDFHFHAMDSYSGGGRKDIGGVYRFLAFVGIGLSDEGFGKNDYIETSRPIVVVTAPGPGSGKMATCLSQLYHEHKRGVTAGYAKYETFPIWNLPLTHPVNIAYEAATADLDDDNIIDPFHLEAYGETTVNYNRDVEIFPVLRAIMERISGACPYQSPTDMGVNMAGLAISDDAVCREAGNNEIVRRYFQTAEEIKRTGVGEAALKKIELLMNQAGINQNLSPARSAALLKEETTGGPAGAMVLPDGRVVTGKTGNLLGAASALLMNALKGVAGVDDELYVISDDVLEPICHLKTAHLRSHNPRLHSDETLLALSISSVHNPLAERLIDNVDKLRGCDAYFSVIISAADEKLYRTLGINVCCEPKYEQHRYYHK